ncbi:unnamed protein product [Microthlaspi erraticum]|uniref:Uncharacterized protein n=1 Tax=Microthlaspi erraticum TaxID=1685480 RepID=A0A6D2HWF0_9BRAS|nr:unnamed protein product [Microthlaspi erraticum]
MKKMTMVKTMKETEILMDQTMRMMSGTVMELSTIGTTGTSLSEMTGRDRLTMMILWMSHHIFRRGIKVYREAGNPHLRRRCNDGPAALDDQTSVMAALLADPLGSHEDIFLETPPQKENTRRKWPTLCTTMLARNLRIQLLIVVLASTQVSENWSDWIEERASDG